MGLLARFLGRSEVRERSKAVVESGARYRGVQIIAGADGCCRTVRERCHRERTDGCCREAEVAAEDRFLAHQVPRLPLDGCDRERCSCTYRLFDDRRTDLRRASDVAFDIAAELRTAPNRRNELGRRRGDVD